MASLQKSSTLKTRLGAFASISSRSPIFLQPYDFAVLRRRFLQLVIDIINRITERNFGE